jgi:hypothetical protein
MEVIPADRFSPRLDEYVAPGGHFTTILRNQASFCSRVRLVIIFQGSTCCPRHVGWWQPCDYFFGSYYPWARYFAAGVCTLTKHLWPLASCGVQPLKHGTRRVGPRFPSLRWVLMCAGDHHPVKLSRFLGCHREIWAEYLLMPSSRSACGKEDMKPPVMRPLCARVSARVCQRSCTMEAGVNTGLYRKKRSRAGA